MSLPVTGAGRSTHGTGPRPDRGTSTMARAEARAGFGLIAPTVIIVLLVVVVPIIWTILLAFQDLRLINLRRAGLFGDFTLANFTQVLTSSGFLEALFTTLVYSVLGTGSAIVIGLIAALALRKPFRGRNLVRACMLLPYVAPVVAVTFVWRTMLNPQFGVVNHWGTRLLGWDEPIAFLTQRTLDVSIFGWSTGIPIALLTVIAFEAWRSFPFAFIFLTARLHAVPAGIEEAARVDGATPLQRFRYVILPQLMPTIAVLTVLRFIWTFNSFDDIYLLTGGGAGTEVVAVRVFDFLTSRGDIGAASAQALVLALILALLVGVYMRRFARKEEVA
ncbi:sugar ABC transporter permease [Phytoactinopolyspora alkaliphila]|uniref:Sugar ABC transporter permease n=1 Tax=Phytoactinopolyspora alkaliphila TaxID=1783498 RepID=A0A6N9YI03_9ACTN|nr:sugar ABC transporter permease [Phytoactinopolyspora alkaliphila]NED94681.1 sugar ABC transporter permease [Phytoactinopolyspora alkaliphila]